MKIYRDEEKKWLKNYDYSNDVPFIISEKDINIGEILLIRKNYYVPFLINLEKNYCLVKKNKF